MAVARTLARPYAKAIFMLTPDNASKQQWQEFLNAVCYAKNTEIFTEIREYLTNSQNNFLKLLASAKKLYILPEIAKIYNELCLQQDDCVAATLTTAIDLDDSSKLKFTNQLAALWNKKVILKYKINKELLGGFIVKSGNDIIDCSVQTALSSMQQAFSSRG